MMEQHNPSREAEQLSEAVDIGILREASFGNPRKIAEKNLRALQESVARFGDIGGIVLDKTHGMICGHQRVRALRAQFGTGLTLERDNAGALHLVTPDGERFFVREVKWDTATCKAANLVANSPLVEGEFTAQLGAVILDLHNELPDLTDALRIPELRVPSNNEKTNRNTDTMALPQAVQLKPARQYVVIVCDDDDAGIAQWDKLRELLHLQFVRRGGYKEGSSLDHVRLERVVPAMRLFKAISIETDADVDGAVAEDTV